jgi:phosphate transport system permease protein
MYRSKMHRLSAFDALIWCTATIIAFIFCVIIGQIVWHGLPAINWSFLTSAPINAGRQGGIFPIIVSTLMIIAVCMAAALPIGLCTAVFLAEFTRRSGTMAVLIRRSLDVLAGVPSIVFGLFGNAFFCKVLGFGFSIFSGGLTLACMVLPILIRSTEEGLRAVPEDYRRGAAALGMSKTSTVLKLILPTAVPGLIVGMTLGIGRALAETAALIFTSGYVDRMPESIWDSGRALSIHIYDLSMNISGGDLNAYGSSLSLIVILAMANIFAAGIAGRWMKHKVMS